MLALWWARVVYLAWVVGGMLSFFWALTYAELGAMRPQAGGEYVYVRDAYGPLSGFLYAWTWVAIAAAVFISFLNYIGVKKAGEFQLVFTLLKIAIILGIVVVCFGGGRAAGGGWSHFSGVYLGAKGGNAGFMAALVAALWAYDGWNDLNMVAGEVKQPERNIPIALIAGVATVGLLYVLVNAAVQYVLPADVIAVSERPASDAVAHVLGRMGASIVSAGMAISMLVTLNGTIMRGARVPCAVARDGCFFSSLAEVHPRFRTPSVAIVVQAILSIALLLLGANFRQLFSLAIFAEWLFYMIAGSTVFVFRSREPDAPRPYRMWGYPIVPALFVAVATALLLYTFKNNWPHSAYGLLVILAGIPFFAYFSSRRRRASASSS